MKKLSFVLNAILAVIGIGLFIGISVAVSNHYLNPTVTPPTPPSQALGSVSMISDRNYIDAIGTAASPYVLQPTYASSTSATLRIPGLSNVVLAGQYLPKSYGSTLYVIIERSIDYGTTWFPYETLTPSTDRFSVYDLGLATTSSFAAPFVIPSGGTSASGTIQSFSFDATLAADYIRVSAKESTTSTAGTLYLKMLSTNH